MITTFVFALLALAPTTSQTPVAPKPTVQELFASAAKDPAAVVPLIVEGSTAMVTMTPTEARAFGDSLEPFCARAFFSPERLPGMERVGLVIHKVEQGENPTKIAQRYGIGPGLLRYLNADFDERRMHVGQGLKVLDLSKEKLLITVARSQFRLTAWRTMPEGGHVLVQFCAVGMGAVESPTPLGRTTITKRVLNPPWTDPQSKVVYAPGDPGNVLGGYWIALDSAGIGRTGIGFHGYTGAPASDWISKGASHGCVRMLQQDVDRIFHVAIEGTSVAIVE